MNTNSKSQKGQQGSTNQASKPQGIGSQSELDMDNEDQAGSIDQNEGEGSRTAAQRYNEATEEYARSGKVEPKAREAADALDSPEGEQLRDAEEKGKQGPDWGGSHR